MFPGGYPTVCSGVSTDNYTDLCYKYDPLLNSWAEAGQVRELKKGIGYDYSGAQFNGLKKHLKKNHSRLRMAYGGRLKKL